MEPDLKLILDGDTPGSHIEIIVWHQVMVNASPYFRSMLSPGRFAEGSKLASNGSVEIAMPETDAQAMKVICDIFHFRHDEIPVSEMTSTLLFNIVVLIDKFDCGTPLQPWLHKWVEQDHIQKELNIIVQMNSRATVQELSKWIYIFQILENAKLLNLFVSTLIRFRTIRSCMRKENTCFDQLPSALIDKITYKQKQVISSLHAIMIDFAELVERGNTCRLGLNPDVGYLKQDTWDDDSNEEIPTDQFQCISVTLGNFLFAASAELGSTWRLLDSWTGTVDSTYRRLQRVARHLTGPSQIARGALTKHDRNTETHEECSLRQNFSERVEHVVKMLDD